MIFMSNYNLLKKAQSTDSHGANQYENSLGNRFVKQFRRAADYVQDSKFGMAAEKVGRSVANEVKFMSSSLLEAARESAEKHGIPTKRSYWKEHPWDAVFTTVMGGLTIYTGYQFGAALSDPDVCYDLGFGQVPKGTTIFPIFNNPQNYYSNDPRLIPTEPVLGNLSVVSGLALPFAIPIATLVGEYVRYNGWKKSIQKVEEDSKKW